MGSFYTIDFDYLRFLKEKDSKVPNFEYEEHDKFFFGVVLEIDEKKYYVPVSSKKIKNQTSMLIKEYSNSPGGRSRDLGTLRFGYMLPVPEQCLEKLDFEWLRLTKGPNYADLVNQEYEFCKRNIERIKRRATRVYYFGTHESSPFFQYCCDFKKLEAAIDEWMLNNNEE